MAKAPKLNAFTNKAKMSPISVRGPNTLVNQDPSSVFRSQVKQNKPPKAAGLKVAKGRGK